MHRVKDEWLAFLEAKNERTDNWWSRKLALLDRRDAEIIRINGNGQIFEDLRYDDETHVKYLLHLSFLIKQRDHYYIEEHVKPYQFWLKNGDVVGHKEVSITRDMTEEEDPVLQENLTRNHSKRFTYDRLAAVQYAERWWNNYNPNFQRFSVDCTNFVSQCLYAGGAPMRGAPSREEGWWYQGKKWSFSWSVAHSLRWYLSGSTQGLRGKEVESAGELEPGDVICYDFEGDGRYDHTTFVVAKDAKGMPLVNAHTENSRHRYWSYEDSTAWTPDMKYKFFQIGKE